MTGRTYHPTTRHLTAWRRLVRQARLISRAPTAPMGDLLAAAKTASKAVAPSDEALTRFAAPLVRLAQAWPAMDDAARGANAERLWWLAEGLSALVGETEEGGLFGARPPAVVAAARVIAPERLRFQPPVEPFDDPRPARAPRADLEG